MICPNDRRPHKLYIRAVSKKSDSQLVVENPSNEESSVKTSKKAERAPRRSRKKVAAESSDRSSMETVSTVSEEETSAQSVSAEETKKVSRRARTKGKCHLHLISACLAWLELLQMRYLSIVG